jgi:hypothetical protein
VTNKKKTGVLGARKFENLRSWHYTNGDASECAGIVCMHSLPLAADGRHIHDSAFYGWCPLTWRMGSSRSGLDTQVLLFLAAQFLVLRVYRLCSSLTNTVVMVYSTECYDRGRMEKAAVVHNVG